MNDVTLEEQARALVLLAKMLLAAVQDDNPGGIMRYAGGIGETLNRIIEEVRK
jgi:hypothetical protein